MADRKITQLDPITDVAAGDLGVLVDISDATMAPSGTDKRITIGELAAAVTAIGGLATDADVVAAIDSLSAVFQPLDSDLSAIAALSTTAYGRGLLVLAGQSQLMALLAAATDATTGVVELATTAETTTGTDTGRATTPAGVKAAVDAGIAALIDSAPGALDTLNELAAALGDDPNFASTVTNALAGKQPLDSDLTAIAALTTTTFGRSLLTQADAAATRAVLGLGTLATQAASAVTITGGTITGITDVAVADGGTGASDAANARTNLGLGTAAVLAAAAVFGQAQPVNAQTGTTYTLAATDAGKLVTLSNGAAVTLTVPQDSDATIPIGTYVDLLQAGAGQVTVAAGTGATLRVSGLTAKARAQWSRLGAQKIAANTWSLYGDLASS